MDPERFAKRFPVLYHATHANNVPGIKKHGLLCAEDIVLRAKLAAHESDRLLTQPRPDFVSLDLPDGEIAILRDQKPLRIDHLKRRHPQVSTSAYVYNLSKRIFFWHCHSKATETANDRYRGQKQIIIEIDTVLLLRDFAARIELCRVNSGALLMPASVGALENRNPASMFSAIRDCPWPLSSIKEVTLTGSLFPLDQYLFRGAQA
jgi:hypothetical protein